MATHVDRAVKRRWAAEKSGTRLGAHTRTHTRTPEPHYPSGIRWAASPLRVLPLSHWLVRDAGVVVLEPFHSVPGIELDCTLDLLFIP